MSPNHTVLVNIRKAAINDRSSKDKAITEANKDKTEFSILLNSENNNNSKEITMDTNMGLPLHIYLL